MIIWKMMAAVGLITAGVAQADIGQIKNVSGTVMLLRNGVEQTAQQGDLLEQQDVIITGADGSVGMTFIDNTRFSAGPDSRIELSRFRFDTTTHEGEFLARIKRGTLSVSSGDIAKQSDEAMKIHTPTSVLAVRGTRFVIKVDD